MTPLEVATKAHRQAERRIGEVLRDSAEQRVMYEIRIGELMEQRFYLGAALFIASLFLAGAVL